MTSVIRIPSESFQVHPAALVLLLGPMTCHLRLEASSTTSLPAACSVYLCLIPASGLLEFAGVRVVVLLYVFMCGVCGVYR